MNKTIFGLVVLACGIGTLVGCKDKGAACFNEGDESACNALCETGKPEHQSACFEMRARSLVSCVDGKADCAAGCTAWKNAQASSEDVRNVYVAKLGTEAKVKAANAKCGLK